MGRPGSGVGRAHPLLGFSDKGEGWGDVGCEQRPAGAVERETKRRWSGWTWCWPVGSEGVITHWPSMEKREGEWWRGRWGADVWALAD